METWNLLLLFNFFFTKSVLNRKCGLNKSLHEVLCRIDNWIDEGSGGVIESVDAEYVNIYICSPLSGSTYIELPFKLRNLMEGLIDSKNNDSEFFICWHIRHLNSLKIHPQIITKSYKNMSMILILARLKKETIFALMCFVMRVVWFILFIYLMKNLKIVWIY